MRADAVTGDAAAGASSGLADAGAGGSGTAAADAGGVAGGFGTVTEAMVCDAGVVMGPEFLDPELRNRKAIGIEVEEKYCEVAAKRLAQEVLEFG